MKFAPMKPAPPVTMMVMLSPHDRIDTSLCHSPQLLTVGRLPVSFRRFQQCFLANSGVAGCNPLGRRNLHTLPHPQDCPQFRYQAVQSRDRAVLHGEFSLADAELIPIAEQRFKARCIFRRADDEDVLNSRKHQRGQGLADQRLSYTGSSCFDVTSVKEYSLVPAPPAKMMPFICILRNYSSL